jgi:glycosyltransferase involved in cell wall biosynthesis
LVATFNSQDDKHKKWGIIARTYLKFGEWIINNVPDKTIVVSEILQKYVRDEYGKDAVVIRNGAAVEATTSSHEIRKWNLEKRKYFLSVSRLVGHKGIHYLINAFKKAQENREIPDYFKLVIAGDSAHTDDYVAHLKNISKNNQNIIFLGNQFGINLSQLFANALAFVQPSEAEGLSNALLEAMGYGIAPIVSNIAENVAAVGKNGLSFENKNEDDLREKLVLAVKEPKLLEEFGRKARLDVLENYNWDKNAKKTLRLYADLLFQKNHKSLAVDYFKR